MIKATLISIIALLYSITFIGFNKIKIKLPKEYVYITGGTFRDGDQETGKTASMFSHYISKYEITNLQYRTFLNEVLSTLSKDDIEKIKVDSSGWYEISLYCSSLNYPTNYFNHPAYNNYPVVNISYEGALKYCEWLQQKIQKDNPGFMISVKLPTRLQWIYDAMGGRSYAHYAWGGNYLRDKHGKFLCNFNFVDECSIIRNKETGQPEITDSLASHKNSFTTDIVGTYYPNDFGLYNMCGNVAEMIDTIGICLGGSWRDFGGDVKVTSKANYTKPSPTVGFRPIIIVKETPLK